MNHMNTKTNPKPIFAHKFLNFVITLLPPKFECVLHQNLNAYHHYKTNDLIFNVKLKSSSKK